MIFSPTEENIHLAAQHLKDGNLVAFPTETVYGLGGNALDDKAIGKIYAAKNRPNNNPLIVHVANVNQVYDVASLEDNPLIEKRFKRLSSVWPAPLSLILPRGKNISKALCANQDTVAVRIPEHQIALKLLKIANIPVAAPSANKSGYVSPTRAEHVLDLEPSLSMIIDGGECSVGIESTVVSLLEDKVTILRPGKISKQQLESLLNEEVLVKTTYSKEELEQKTSPGLDISHYAPNTRLVKSHKFSKKDKAAAILFSEKTKQDYPTNFKIITLSRDYNQDEIARNLYACLRELDELGLDYIVLDEYSRTLVGNALYDRLERATQRK